MSDIKNIHSFETGIESIISLGPEQTPASLPEVANFLPSEEQLDAWLQKMLASPPLEQQLLSLLKPVINDLTILQPVHYEFMIFKLGEKFKRLVAYRKKKKPKEEDRQIFEEARDLFTEEQSLRELLKMYRNALLRG